jgi:hypothetical protein
VENREARETNVARTLDGQLQEEQDVQEPKQLGNKDIAFSLMELLPITLGKYPED